MRFFFKLFLLPCFLVFLSACATHKKRLRDHDGTYLESVRLNYEAGQKALKNGDFDAALGYFQFVRGKFPFSKFAALSDLRIADVKFDQKKWPDAASAYEVFIRLHPRHSSVEYAYYRLGMSHFNAAPADLFFMPPSTSKDQSFTKEALAVMDRFILQYPKSIYAEEVKQKQKILFSKLAKHNQYVAGYYEKRGRYYAAIDRYLRVIKLYPDTEEAASSLYFAAEIFLNKLKDKKKAIPLYNQLIMEKKDSLYAQKARLRLEQINAENDS